RPRRPRRAPGRHGEGTGPAGGPLGPGPGGPGETHACAGAWRLPRAVTVVAVVGVPWSRRRRALAPDGVPHVGEENNSKCPSARGSKVKWPSTSPEAACGGLTDRHESVSWGPSGGGEAHVTRLLHSCSTAQPGQGAAG